MNNLIKCLLLISTVSLTSCNRIIFGIAGLRVPSVEDKNSTFTFLQKAGQDTSDVFVMDTNLLQHMRSLEFKPGWDSSFRPVQIRVYNRKGKPVAQWASCEGPLSKVGTFDSVPPRNQGTLNESMQLGEDLYQYFNFDGSPAHLIPAADYDYYILIYFAKWFPRMSRESFRQVASYSKKHPELKIKVYKISVDAQKFWGDEIVFIRK